MGDAEIADVLERAADLIEPEGHFTSQSYARDEHGQEIPPDSRFAVCWCAMGAISRVGGHNHPLMHAALSGLAEDLPEPRKFSAHVGGAKYIAAIAQWNDNSTQAEVVAKLREAAAKARDPK